MPADMDKGVRIVFADGTAEVFRRLDADRIETFYGGSGEQARDTLGQGMFLLRSDTLSEPGGNKDFRVDYGIAAANLPAPEPQKSYRLSAREVFSDGSDDLTETYVTGRLRDVQIGSCRLQAFDVKLTRDFGEPPIQLEKLRYLPALGFAYVTGVGDLGKPVETFDLIRIEAVE